ncbi:MAG: GNAT family N-acetyltransferase [Candidatus Bathyarchaeota archaeon]|nr:MAG: GNAT family N-acetyltransferase [Candidatus Bathyarchaeota archaeon]
MPITVRRATINDLETLYKIERECFTLEAFTKQHIAFLLENPRNIRLAAWENDEIAGFIIGLIQNFDETRIGRVYTLDVAVKHRRKGIGLKLLHELEQVLIEKGVKNCYLEARTDNVAARELYLKHGYIEVKQLKDYYSKGIHGVLLVKKLL